MVRVWNGKRQTTFVGVEITPILPDEQVNDIDIPDKDLEVSSFRAGGAGGQGMQKNESACRVKHVPTGLTKECRNSRSLIENKAEALRGLKAKLVAVMQQQQLDRIDAIR